MEQASDGGFYTLDEAKARQEIARLRAQAQAQGISQGMAVALCDELGALRNRDLEKAKMRDAVWRCLRGREMSSFKPCI